MTDQPDNVFEVYVHLRWADMDALAHVNNVQVARLFEEARVRAFAAWLTDRPPNFGLLVGRQDIEFHAPLMYTADPVRVATRITRLGTASFDFGYTLVDPSGTICAVAQTTMVVMDTAIDRSAPIPEGIRAVLQSRVGSPVPFRR